MVAFKEISKNSNFRKNYMEKISKLKKLSEEIEQDLFEIFDIKIEIPKTEIYTENIPREKGIIDLEERKIILDTRSMDCYLYNKMDKECFLNYIVYGNFLAHELMHNILYQVTRDFIEREKIREKLSSINKYFWISEFLSHLVGLLYEYSKNEYLKTISTRTCLKDKIKRYITKKIEDRLNRLILESGGAFLHSFLEKVLISKEFDDKGILDLSKKNIRIISYPLTAKIAHIDALSTFYFYEEKNKNVSLDKKLENLWQVAKEIYKDVEEIENERDLNEVFEKWFTEFSLVSSIYRKSGKFYGKVNT